MINLILIYKAWSKSKILNAIVLIKAPKIKKKIKFVGFMVLLCLMFNNGIKERQI